MTDAVYELSSQSCSAPIVAYSTDEMCTLVRLMCLNGNAVTVKMTGGKEWEERKVNFEEAGL